MPKLITRISTTAGITTEQAMKAVEAVKDFVKEKFPMMAGAVDNLFASEATSADVIPAPVTTAGATTVVPDPSAPLVPESTILDKISDVIPGERGQKVEDFVKGAAHKAEDVYDSVKEKLNGVFGGDKK